MYTTLVSDEIELGYEGLTGDYQADRRVHSPPEKAAHLYPSQHRGVQ